MPRQEFEQEWENGWEDDLGLIGWICNAYVNGPAGHDRCFVSNLIEIICYIGNTKGRELGLGSDHARGVRYISKTAKVSKRSIKLMMRSVRSLRSVLSDDRDDVYLWKMHTKQFIPIFTTLISIIKSDNTLMQSIPENFLNHTFSDFLLKVHKRSLLSFNREGTSRRAQEKARTLLKEIENVDTNIS